MIDQTCHNEITFADDSEQIVNEVYSHGSGDGGGGGAGIASAALTTLGSLSSALSKPEQYKILKQEIKMNCGRKPLRKKKRVKWNACAQAIMNKKDRLATERMAHEERLQRLKVDGASLGKFGAGYSPAPAKKPNYLAWGLGVTAVIAIGVLGYMAIKRRNLPA